MHECLTELKDCLESKSETYIYVGRDRLSKKESYHFECFVQMLQELGMVHLYSHHGDEHSEKMHVVPTKQEAT